MPNLMVNPISNLTSGVKIAKIDTKGKKKAYSEFMDYQTT
jgi:hypothetical protein